MLQKLWQIVHELIPVVGEMRRKLRNVTVGPGLVMKNEPGALYIGLAAKREYRPESVALGGGFRARITAVTGSFPAWSYTCQRITGYDSSQTGAARWVTDGVDITGVLNAMEFAPAGGTYPYTYGNGSNITDSAGTIDSGGCVIIPIGVGARVWLSVDTDTNGGALVYSFEESNGSEAP